MKLRILAVVAIALCGCSKSQKSEQDALKAIDEHTTKMRKILLDNQDNCDRAVELYGAYVDKHLETLKELKARVHKMLKDDQEGKLTSWAQEMSAKSSRDLSLFYYRCSGRTYGTKISKIDRRFK